MGSVDSFFLGLVLGFVLWAAGWFLDFLLSAGLIRAALAITRGETPDASMLFSTDRLAPFAVASMLVAVLTFVGFFACCIGALVVWFFTFFYGYFVIDRDLGPTESVGSSFNMVQGQRRNRRAAAHRDRADQRLHLRPRAGVTFIALAYAYKTLNGEPVAA